MRRISSCLLFAATSCSVPTCSQDVDSAISLLEQIAAVDPAPVADRGPHPAVDGREAGAEWWAHAPSPIVADPPARDATSGERAAWSLQGDDAMATAPRHSWSAAPHDGLRHEAGDNVAIGQVYYGLPILNKSFFWDGNGEVYDFGASFRLLHFVGTGVALGGGLTGTTWLVGGADVYSLEGEGILRWYPGNGRAFFDLTGGWLQATRGIPPGGTQWNMTFGFGPGVDVPVGDNTSLVTGVFYHHVSNALGRQNLRNPSQNEARLWIGLAWNF